MRLHPKWATRTCQSCRTYAYNSEGEICRIPQKSPTGTPVRRTPLEVLPCGNCPKIPPGAEPLSVNAIELTAQNARVYVHYLECKYTNSFPDDPLVKRHAAIIGLIEDACDRNEMSQLVSLGILTRSAGEK